MAQAQFVSGSEERFGGARVEPAAQNTDHLPRFRTELSMPIELATYRNYLDTRPVAWNGTYQDLFDTLSTPEERYGSKNSRGFLIGPCAGRKIKSNMTFGWVAVIDADKSFDSNYNHIEGAPSPAAVHNALKDADISHCLYTTTSHGLPHKGNRYRIVFPVIVLTEIELKAFLTHVVELLNTKYELPLVLTSESHRFAQFWQFPRKRDEEAEFFAATYAGTIPNPKYWVKQYDLDNELSARMPKFQNASEPLTDSSLYGQMNKYLPVTKQLAEAGYTFVSQGFQHDHAGELIEVQRWRKPESTSTPGVVVFELGGRQLVYSHHSNDPLATGSVSDSLKVFSLLRGLTPTEALPHAIEELQVEIANELNVIHPSVMLAGNEFRLGTQVEDDNGSSHYVFMNWTNFSLYCANQPPVWRMERGRDNEEAQLTCIPRDQFWKSSQQRTLYKGTTFAPSPLGEEPEKTVERRSGRYYNTFVGWAIEPRPGKWPLLEWHLRNSICGGGDEEYEYLLNYFSHLVQKPAEKPGVALVLRGKKGTGKSLAISKLIKALGRSALVLGQSDQLTNNFNIHLEGRLVVLLEESFWSGNPQAEGVLKTLITDTDTTYTRKGIDSQEGKSYARIVFNTNNDWAVPVSEDERRYFLPTITDASYQRNLTTRHHKDGDFFPFLLDELNLGGCEAFYHFVLNREITGSVFSPPKTSGLFDQYKESLSREDAWLFETMNSGRVVVPSRGPILFEDTGLNVSLDDIAEAVAIYLGPHEKKHSVEHRVERVLKRMLPNTAYVINQGGHAVVRFGSLKACRQDYQKNTRMPIEWRQSTDIGP